MLQNPERVIPSSECERFERTFQPNVALAPPLLKKRRCSRESAIRSPPVKQERQDEEPHSTGVSVVQSTPKYGSEIELSTDTEDSASEAAEKNGEMGKIEEALKSVEEETRNRVMELVRRLAKEKDGRIEELEARVAELERKEPAPLVNGNAKGEETEEEEEEKSEVKPPPQQTSVIASVEQKAIVAE